MEGWKWSSKFDSEKRDPAHWELGRRFSTTSDSSSLSSSSSVRKKVVVVIMMVRETRRVGEQQRQMAGKAGDSFAQSSLQVSLHTNHD